jgi:dTDP-4-amino-4,6-dideoxygalactose transaminase
MIVNHSDTYIGNTDREALLKALDEKKLAAGKLFNSLNNALREFFSTPQIVLFNSGASSFYHILAALELKPDDEVLLPDYICPSILKAVSIFGCRAVLYDNSYPWTSSIAEIKRKISPNSKVVLINHTFGIRFPDYDKLSELGLIIIEDCCHVFNTEIDGLPIGTKSLCAFYSFNSTKFIAAGEGGAVKCNNQDFFEHLRKRTFGNEISDLQAALALSQLNKISYFVKRRREIADFYFEWLPKEVTQNLQTYKSAFFRFPVLTNKQNKFLASDSVQYRKGVDNLLHFETGEDGNNFPNALRDYNTTVSLPIYPSLKDEDLNYIITDFNQKYGHS